MTDEEFEIYRQGQLIDPIRVEIPKQISEISAHDFGYHGDPVEMYKAHLKKMDALTKRAKKPKKKIKEKVMNVILQKIWQFLRDVFLQWVYPFAIYKKDEFDKPIVNHKTGKFEVNWLATIVARALSFIVATWGTMELLGMSVAEWVARISQAFGL